MRLALLALVGCASSPVADGKTKSSCRDMAFAIEQFDGAVSVSAFAVTRIAWCGTVECSMSNPQWLTVCGSLDDCRYEGHCVDHHDGIISCDTEQRLDGVMGLTIITDGVDQFSGECVFQKAMP